MVGFGCGLCGKNEKKLQAGIMLALAEFFGICNNSLLPNYMLPKGESNNPYSIAPQVGVSINYRNTLNSHILFSNPIH